MSTYTNKLAAVALDQYNTYHLVRETDPKLAAQIKKYWQGIDDFPGVEEPWSAVFVSWCVKQAGATAAEFKFNAQHSQFVFQAIQNQVAGTGVFRGWEVAKYAPKVGDILHNNRAKPFRDFAYAKSHASYASHSAIVIEVGHDSAGRYLRTIGGNESDSVGMKEVRLDTKGFVKNPNGVYISIIETLK